MNFLKRILLVDMMLCVVPSLAHSQDRSTSSSLLDKRAVKVNVNVTRSFGHNANFSIGDLAPAFVYSAKNFVHEFEFNRLKSNRTETKVLDSQGNITGGNRNTVLELGLRYQLTHGFGSADQKIKPMVGVSLLGLNLYAKNIPFVTNAYPRSTNYIGGIATLIPQIRYNTSRRLFFDLSLPIDFYEFGFRFQKISNPAIPVRQQRNGGFENENYFFEQLHIRFGSGIRF